MRPITEAKFLTNDERERLEGSLNKHPLDRDSLVLQLILATGARSCEVLSIKTQDLNFGEGCVTITGAKGSNDRTIPLPTELLKRLVGYIKTLPAGQAKLFPFTTRYLRYIWDLYRPNPKKGIHCLRHTGGILLYLNCRDINTVRAFLGHRNINNTMVYLDYVMGVRELKKAMKGMWGQRI